MFNDLWNEEWRVQYSNKGPTSAFTFLQIAQQFKNLQIGIFL